MHRLLVFVLAFWLLLSAGICFGQAPAGAQWSVSTYKKDVQGQLPQLYEAPDGGFLVMGQYQTAHNPELRKNFPGLPADSNFTAMVVQKYDPNGKQLWEKVYPEPPFDELQMADYAWQEDLRMYYSENGTELPNPERIQIETLLKHMPFPKIRPDLNGMGVFFETNHFYKNREDTLVVDAPDGGIIKLHLQSYIHPQLRFPTDTVTFRWQQINGKHVSFGFARYKQHFSSETPQHKYQISPASDGGFIAMSNRPVMLDNPGGGHWDVKIKRPYMSRHDAEGNILWSKYLMNLPDNEVYVMHCTPDNFTVAGGHFLAPPNYDWPCNWVYGISPDGNIAWKLEAEQMNIAKVSDGGTVLVHVREPLVAGRSSEPIEYQMYSQAGKLLWTYTYNFRKAEVSVVQVYNDGAAEFLVQYFPESDTVFSGRYAQSAIIRISKTGKAKEIYRNSNTAQNVYQVMPVSDGCYILVSGLPGKNQDGNFYLRPEFYSIQKISLE